MTGVRLTQFVTFITIVQTLSFPVWAAPKSSSSLEPIPTRPSAPPPLSKQIPATPFLCERKYVHKGKTLTCDSNLGRDGEGLKSVLSEVPDALHELETYQYTRKIVRKIAYVGTGGLLLAFTGWLVSNQLRDDPNTISSTGVTVRNITVIGGLGVALVGLLYGFTLNTSNENHLHLAVQKYNEVKPQTPIELQFSAGISF